MWKKLSHPTRLSIRVQTWHVWKTMQNENNESWIRLITEIFNLTICTMSTLEYENIRCLRRKCDDSRAASSSLTRRHLTPWSCRNMKNMLMIDRSFTKPTNFRIEVRNFYRIIASLTSTYGYKLTPKRFRSVLSFVRVCPWSVFESTELYQQLHLTSCRMCTNSVKIRTFAKRM